MTRLLSVLLVGAVISCSAGCATGAKRENMAYEPAGVASEKYDARLRDNTSVETVRGGEETNPAWTSEIGDAEFEGALKLSLASAGMLRQGGRYGLNVELLKVEQPLFGFSTTVTTHIHYRLMDSHSRKLVYDQTLVTPYTATMSDSFFGIRRLRLANEGSAKENIKALISALEQLDLKADGLELTEKDN